MMADWPLALALGAGVMAFYTGLQLDKMSKRVVLLERSTQALHEYIKEIDPRHDLERAYLQELEDGGLMAGMHHRDLVNAKRARGERTLFDPIIKREDL